jgi:hypothetical protein
MFSDNNIVKYDSGVIIFRSFPLDISSAGEHEEDLS